MYNMGWCAKVAKSMCPCQDAWDAEEKPLSFFQAYLYTLLRFVPWVVTRLQF